MRSGGTENYAKSMRYYAKICESNNLPPPLPVSGWVPRGSLSRGMGGTLFRSGSASSGRAMVCVSPAGKGGGAVRGVPLGVCMAGIGGGRV